jgi:hypothetical protein
MLCRCNRARLLVILSISVQHFEATKCLRKFDLAIAIIKQTNHATVQNISSVDGSFFSSELVFW